MSMAALLRTIQVVDCKDFPEGGMWEHGGFAEDYPGRGVPHHSQGRDTETRRTIQAGESKDLPEGGMQEHGGFAEDYPGSGEQQYFRGLPR
jgi:hypothetical protein